MSGDAPRCPQRWALVALAGPLLLAFALGTIPIRTNDTWIHLTTGRWILEHHAVPRTDSYSFTAAGHRYVAHEWLAAVAYAAAERVGGEVGARIAAKLLPALATVLTLAWALRAWRVPLAAGLGLAPLALLAAEMRFAARPDLIVLSLALVLLAGLERDRLRARAGERRARLFMLAVPLTVLWANLHASFPIAIALVIVYLGVDLVDSAARRGGIVQARLHAAAGAAGVVLALFLASREPHAFGWAAAAWAALAVAVFAGATRLAAFARDCPRARSQGLLRLLLLGLAMLAAVLANPRGAEILTFPFEFTTGANLFTTLVFEWRPLLAAQRIGMSLRFAAYAVWIGIGLVALGRAARRGRLERIDFALWFALTLLPWRHVRWLGLAALGATPALARMLVAGRGPAPDRGRGARVFEAALVALGAGVLLFGLALALATRDGLLAAFVGAGSAGALVAAASLLGFVPRTRIAAGASLAAGALLASMTAAWGLPEVARWRLPPDPLLRHRGPVGLVALAAPAIEFLRTEGLTGNLLTEYEWGAYAIHELWPRVRVSIDSRSEVYGEHWLRWHRAIKRNAAAARRMLREFPIDLVLIRYAPYPGNPRVNAAIRKVLRADPRWHLLFADDAALLYARQKPGRQLPLPLDGLDPDRLRPATLDRAPPGFDALLARALARAPGSSLLRFAQAWRLQRRGDREEALALLEEAWRRNPKQAAAPLLAGDLERRRGHLDAARRWYERARSAAPRWPEVRKRLAELER